MIKNKIWYGNISSDSIYRMDKKRMLSNDL